MSGDQRVGFGFDVHRFETDGTRPLILGGLLIEGERGLVGHSDADVVTHAIIDALLGAAGLGDIGTYFPDTDDRWKGANSIDLLTAAIEILSNDHWEVQNVDCTIVAEQPKIAPVRDAMQNRLGESVGAPVNVKASRAEGLGALGRVEGAACYAVALIVKVNA